MAGPSSDEPIQQQTVGRAEKKKKSREVLSSDLPLHFSLNCISWRHRIGHGISLSGENGQVHSLLAEHATTGTTSPTVISSPPVDCSSHQDHIAAVEGRVASCHVHSERCSHRCYDLLSAVLMLRRFAMCLLYIAVRIRCRCARI